MSEVKPTAPRIVTRRVRASREGLGMATGVADTTLQERLVRQTLDSMWVPVDLPEEEQCALLEAAYALLQELAPRDAAEGMLAGQMIAVHSAAMDCLRRAVHPDLNPEEREAAMRHAMRLLALYPRQVGLYDQRRALERRPGTVEHLALASGDRGTARPRRGRPALGHDPEPVFVVRGMDYFDKLKADKAAQAVATE